MPEIYECFYGLAQMFRLFTPEDKRFLGEFKEFEKNAELQMAQNRIKLYTDYGYTGEFESIY